MFTATIGTIVTITIFGCFGWYGFIPLIITAILLLLPIQGFRPKKSETHSIIKLDSSQFRFGKTENVYYVIVDKQNDRVKYAHDIREEYDLKGQVYEEVTITGNIRVFESEECEQPILKIYTREAKADDWTFSPIKLKEYIFFVPKGTVYYI